MGTDFVHERMTDLQADDETSAERDVIQVGNGFTHAVCVLPDCAEC